MDYAKVLLAVCPHGKGEIISGFAAAMPKCIANADLTTMSRLADFIAQCSHESDGLRTTVEYASGRAYEGRVSLGNTQPGDGVRCKGRGLIQSTGATNYRSLSSFFGINFYANPDLLAQFPWAAYSAWYYWKTRNLNKLADAGDFVGETQRINGGTNGLASRKQYRDYAIEALTDLKGALTRRAAAETKKAVTKSKGIAGSAAATGSATISTLHPAVHSSTPAMLLIALGCVAAFGAAIWLMLSIKKHQAAADVLTLAATGVK
jgi:putative chitinase